MSSSMIGRLQQADLAVQGSVDLRSRCYSEKALSIADCGMQKQKPLMPLHAALPNVNWGEWGDAVESYRRN